MLFYIKRILQSIATLWIVVLLIFFAHHLVPTDDVAASMENSVERFGNWNEKIQFREKYNLAAKAIDAHLPLFYFNLSRFPQDDRVEQNVFFEDKKFVHTRLGEGYDLNAAFQLLSYQQQYDKYLFFIKSKISDSTAISTAELAGVKSEFELISKKVSNNSLFLNAFVKKDEQQLADYQINTIAFDRATYPTAEKPFFTLVPHFWWHGRDCQFHQWLLKLIQLDFGKSTYSKRPVFDEIKDAVRWTLLLNLSVLCLAFGVAIPLGLNAAKRIGQRFDRWLMNFLAVIDAIPGFWIATLVLLFLTNNYYHCKIFPSAGLGDFPSDASFWKKIAIAMPHFIAPILCSVVVALPLLTRQMRSAAIGVFQQDYIRTARAKGLSEKIILYQHVFKNSIFPMITIFGSALPSLLIGAILIENVFNIPGMGTLITSAVVQHNFPMLSTLVLLIAMFTMLGTFLSDILYRFFNPMVR